MHVNTREKHAAGEGNRRGLVRQFPAERECGDGQHGAKDELEYPVCAGRTEVRHDSKRDWRGRVPFCLEDVRTEPPDIQCRTNKISRVQDISPVDGHDPVPVGQQAGGGRGGKRRAGEEKNASRAGDHLGVVADRPGVGRHD